MALASKNTNRHPSISPYPSPPQAERERASRTNQELSNATFTPEITHLAQQMARREAGGTPAWERLSKGAGGGGGGASCAAV